MSRSYGSSLPTSLTYIVPSTRGCEPRRPAADMGTDWRESVSPKPGFSRADTSTPDSARGALLWGWCSRHPYLRTSRFHGARPSTRKENSSRDSRRRLLGCARHRGRADRAPRGATNDCDSAPGSGMLTRCPFDRRRWRTGDGRQAAVSAQQPVGFRNGARPSLRTD